MTNTLHEGDNLTIMQSFADCCVDLIYIDPPFNTRKERKGDAGAFDDKYDKDNVAAKQTVPDNVQHLLAFVKSVKPLIYHYLLFMYPRLVQTHRILKETGSIYLHCDPTASHYLKLLMDVVFGKDNFRNEIVWHYQAGTKGEKNFGKKHDIILFFTNGDSYFFEKQSKPIRNTKRYNKKDEEGRLYDINGQGKKYYLDDGATCDDVWTWVQEKEYQQLNSQSKERTGYPTQKPLALLERIIKASSNEGDVVLDAFCGSGTAIIASMRLHRRWIGIDASPDAIKTAQARIIENGLYLS